MQYSYRYLLGLRQALAIDTDLAYAPTEFEHNHKNLRRLTQVHVVGHLEYVASSQTLVVDVTCDYQGVVACAITDEDVPIDRHCRMSESFTFDPNQASDEMLLLSDEFDLSAWVLSGILLDIPLKVVKENLTDYPKGDGWEVLTQEAYEQREKPINPQLAKLKEFKFE